tara:strand:+ start:58 stop:780 length:723 start_codon:yes stop_codon:yes gene_type:complete
MIDLRLGDCLEVMKTIEDNSIDAIITDPPYGATACKWDSVIDFQLMWEQLNRIIKPNGAIVLFGSEPFSSALRMSNIKNYKYDWVWKKNEKDGFLQAKRRPLRDTELISVFNSKIYNCQKIKVEPYKYKRKASGVKSNIAKVVDDGGAMYEVRDFIYPTNTLIFDKPKRKERSHPTQKPIELMEYLIKTYTNDLDYVLDFTMGSGSTMVACRNLNRHGIGIEKEEKYFKIAQERINSTLF